MANTPCSEDWAIKSQTYYLIYWKTPNKSKFTSASLYIFSHLKNVTKICFHYEINWNKSTFISPEGFLMNLFTEIHFIMDGNFGNNPLMKRTKQRQTWICNRTYYIPNHLRIKRNRTFHFIFFLADISNHWNCSTNINCKQFDVMP